MLTNKIKHFHLWSEHEVWSDILPAGVKKKKKAKGTQQDEPKQLPCDRGHGIPFHTHFSANGL